MDKYPIAWGLDIGHSSIKAVKLSRSGGTVTVLGYTIEPITVAEGGDRDEAVVKAMQAMALREDFGQTPVLAALSGRQVLTRSVNIPVLNAAKVDRMVELEARQQIPGDFAEIEWGYHASPSAGGDSMDVALFAVKRDLVQELIAKSKKAGVNLVGVSISSLALYNFVRYDQVFPDDETVIILDVGAENTDLVCYQGESLWMRTLAMSGNDITKAFMKKFRVSFEEAETLKRQTSDSKQADKIIKVIEASLNELTAEVQRSLGFYKSQSPNAKLDNMVISGSTFRLPGLPEYLAERLRYTINILEDLDQIKVQSGLEREHFLHDLQSLGVAMGLALQATGVAKANVNLMPSGMQLQRVLNAKRWAAIAAIVALLIANVVDYEVVKGVADANVALITKIKANDQTIQSQMKDTKTVLDQVNPAAQGLVVYSRFGSQTSLTQLVMAQVTAVIADVQGKHGMLGDKTTAPSQGGDPYLTSIYLHSIDFPSPTPTPGDDPFNPLETPRVVNLEVAILTKAGPVSIIKEIKDGLRAIKVPDHLLACHIGGGENNTAPTAPPRDLFSDVQSPFDSPAVESYFYIDKEHVDDKGDLKPISEERHIQVTVARFVCSLAGKGSAQ
jgi:type IV pilus assembly protein PilM